MLVAIISDIHNNETNLKKVLDYCNKQGVKKIICCGDLASDETLEFLAKNFTEEVFYTFGNMDNGQLREYQYVENYKNIKLFKDFGTAKIGNSDEGYDDIIRDVAFVHFPDEAKKLAESGKYDFVFYGHTHKPWISDIDIEMEGRDKCTMLNPGNVAGEHYLPTFAMWDTEDNNFKLIKVHDLK